MFFCQLCWPIYFLIIHISLAIPGDLFDDLWTNMESDEKQKQNNEQPQFEGQYHLPTESKAQKIKEEPIEIGNEQRSIINEKVKIKCEREEELNIKTEPNIGKIQVKEEPNLIKKYVTQKESEENNSSTDNDGLINEYLSNGSEQISLTEPENSDNEISDDFEDENKDNFSFNETVKNFSEYFNVDKQIKIKCEKNKRKGKLSVEEKKQIVQQYINAKKNLDKKLGRKEIKNLNEAIAHKLGVSTRQIRDWKHKYQIESIRKYSAEKKLKIIRQFDEIVKEHKRNSSKKYTYKTENQIAKEMGINRITITRWRKELGLAKWKKHSEEQKEEIIKKYHGMIRTTEFTQKEIAEMLNVNILTILRWLKDKESKKGQNISSTRNRKTKPTDKSKKFWKWNEATKRRKIIGPKSDQFNLTVSD